MRIRILISVACVVLFSNLLWAQDKSEIKPLENKDIIEMVQNQLDDQTLLAVMEVNDTHFDVSPAALIELKKAGVSGAVIHAMLAAPQRTRTAPASSATAVKLPAPGSASTTANAPPTPAGSAMPAMMPNMNGYQMSPVQMSQMQAAQAQLNAMGLGNIMGMSMGMGMGMPSADPSKMPHVFRLGAQGKEEIAPSTAQIAQTKFKGGGPSGGSMALRSLATEGLSFAALGAGPVGMMAMSAFSMASGFMPGMRPGTPSMTYVWGLPGLHSSRTLGETAPIFEFSYGDIPGIDPDGYTPALVRLVQTRDNYRLVGATRSKMGRNTMMGGAPEEGKWLSEERVPVRLDKEERGFFVLRVEQALEPGEYALVFRPTKGYKAVNSGFSSAAQVFYSVWDFNVPGAPDEDFRKKKKR